MQYNCTDELDLVYEDDQLYVVNKPSGLLSVPGRGDDRQDSVVTRLSHSRVAQFRTSDLPADYSLSVTSRVVYAAHRLDMATSGLMVLAKHKETLRALNEQFSSRTIFKRYLAIVDGQPAWDQRSCEAPLICDWPNRPRQKVCPDGKPSETHVTVLRRCSISDCSLVELTPITGRSHQLRVHMSLLGYPILGDEFYASDQVKHRSTRLLLHASQIGFRVPRTGKLILITQPVDLWTHVNLQHAKRIPEINKSVDCF